VLSTTNGIEQFWRGIRYENRLETQPESANWTSRLTTDDTDYTDFKFLPSALSNQCSSVSSEVVLSSAPSKASCFLQANKSMLLSAVEDAHSSLRHQTSCQTKRARCNTLLISTIVSTFDLISCICTAKQRSPLKPTSYRKSGVASAAGCACNSYLCGDFGCCTFSTAAREKERGTYLPRAGGVSNGGAESLHHF
jgi:hypothetical protein